MRTFIFLCCLTVFSFAPNNLVSQKSSIKIDLDGAMTVDEVFDLIMSQTDYNFIYEVGMFDGYPTIPVKKGRISTNRLLKKSLEPGNLNIVLTTDNTIMVKEAGRRNKLSQITVTGTVTDGEGFPLVNVTVLIKGTNKGVTTDFDGNFSITVPYPENVLQFMHMGFETQEIKVGNQTTLEVVMKETAQALEEVVITAQGIKKSKKALGYAISQVKSEEVEQRPEADLARTLQGKIAGVVITPADGQTGTDSPIRIRGNVSITGSNNPLIVVNDVPFNGLLRDINPNDIESMSILKGFNASVLYGSEGRNGVILIQTKSGSAKVGQAQTKATYSTTVYTNTVSQLPDFQNTYSNGGEGEFQPTYLSNWGPAFSEIGTIDHPYAPLSDIFPQYEGATMNIAAKPNNVRNIFRTGVGTT
ncbi:MAG: TonB-dependent receptor plug domain-containing protein, partial [Algicola sp.]|nr:TonB-dependent receptor plug domain-containing protein [Algicola sp.]